MDHIGIDVHKKDSQILRRQKSVGETARQLPPGP